MSCSAFALALLLSPVSAWAVGATATLAGRVVDASGALVVNARVQVRHRDTGARRETFTAERGEFVFALLRPGSYDVTAEAPGFRETRIANLKLDVDESARIEIILAVGRAEERVEVTSVASASAARGQVLSQERVRSLPLNERNFLNFALLAPGVQMPADGSATSIQGGAISVNGAREQSNNFLLDGIDNNDLMINQYSVLPSVDAIEEFKIQSGYSSAEFGRSAGAQVNVVLKSGTNTFHGSAYEFLRNRNLDAKNYFDLPDCHPGMAAGTCGATPRLDRSQFGATFGGPIRRDKLFFFASYEGLLLRQATTRAATVPSLAQRSAALAAIPPTLRNPAGLAVFTRLPLANTGDDLATSDRYTSSPLIHNETRQLTAKVDLAATARDALAAHYSLYDEDQLQPFDPLLPPTNLPGYGQLIHGRGQHAGLNWTHTLSPRAVNELRVGFNRRRGTNLQQSAGTDYSRILGFPDVLTRAVDLGYPLVTIAGIDGIGEARNLPQERRDNTIQVAENLAWNPRLQGGAHQFKFGGEVRRVRSLAFLDAIARGQWFFLGAFTGDPLQDLLLGMPTFVITARGTSDADFRTTAWNLYAQDDVRITNNLSLSMGLRWEYNQPPVEAQNRLAFPVLSAASLNCAPKPDCQFQRAGTGGVPRSGFASAFDHFAPRLGLAWRPFGTQRLSLRAAYGIFYDTGVLNANFLPRFNPPFYATPVYVNTGTSTIQNILATAAVPQPPIAVALASNFRDAYVQHWHAGTEWELGRRTTLEVDYAGSKGTALPLQLNANQSRPGAGVFPYPQFGPINLIASSGSSIYHALQVRGERRLTSGISLLAAYTWSKSIDNASALFPGKAESGFPQDSFDLRQERGLSDFHAGQRLVLNGTYDLPFGRRRRWLRQGALAGALGNWTIGSIAAVQSGRPFTINRGIDQSDSGTATLGIFADRPNQIADPFVAGPVASNPDPLCHAIISQGGRAADHVRTAQTWFNPCAFAAPGIAFGDAGRNTLLGPGLEQIDLALLKAVSLRGERHRLEARVEFFNLFNHPNFDLPDRIFDSGTFARLRSANAQGNKPPRQIQLGIRYSF